jgi:anti-anti-sigma factor
MFTSQMKPLFSPPGERVASADHPQGGASALPRRSHVSVTAPGIAITVSQTADALVIKVKGEARVEFAGALMDGLLDPAARRPAAAILDLGELHSISSLAMGVLVAYRRGVLRAGGRLYLAKNLQPEVHEALAQACLLDLFETPVNAGAA